MPHSVSSSNSNFTLYPLAWLTICFTFGVLIGNLLMFSWQIYLVVCLISAILPLILIRKNFAVIFIFLAFTSLGGLSLEIEKMSVSSIRLKILFDSAKLNSGEPIELVGVTQGKPELAVDGLFLILKTEAVAFKGLEQKSRLRPRCSGDEAVGRAHAAVDRLPAAPEPAPWRLCHRA